MFESCGGCCLLVIVIPLVCCLAVGGVALYVSNNAPDQPVDASFTPTQREANEFQIALDNAVNNARTSGWFYLGFSERQLSSWMALEGEDFADAHGHVFPFRDMQVGLDDGDMTFYGEIDPGVMAFPVAVVIDPQVSTAGDMTFDITSVDVAGVRAPDFVTEVVSKQFEDLLIQPLDDLPGNVIFYQQTLKVDDGWFEIQGIIRP